MFYRFTLQVKKPCMIEGFTNERYTDAFFGSAISAVGKVWAGQGYCVGLFRSFVPVVQQAECMWLLQNSDTRVSNDNSDIQV